MGQRYRVRKRKDGKAKGIATIKISSNNRKRLSNTAQTKKTSKKTSGKKKK